MRQECQRAACCGSMLPSWCAWSGQLHPYSNEDNAYIYHSMAVTCVPHDNVTTWPHTHRSQNQPSSGTWLDWGTVTHPMKPPALQACLALQHTVCPSAPHRVPLSDTLPSTLPSTSSTTNQHNQHRQAFACATDMRHWARLSGYHSASPTTTRHGDAATVTVLLVAHPRRYRVPLTPNSLQANSLLVSSSA